MSKERKLELKIANCREEELLKWILSTNSDIKQLNLQVKEIEEKGAIAEFDIIRQFDYNLHTKASITVDIDPSTVLPTIQEEIQKFQDLKVLLITELNTRLMPDG